MKHSVFNESNAQKSYFTQIHYFKTPTGGMYYLDEGIGEPVVLVYENLVKSILINNILKRIPKSCRYIIPDLFNFGLANKLCDRNFYFSYQVKKFNHLLTGLDLTHITFVVNGWGSPFVFSFALNHADKIKKIIMVNTHQWLAENNPYI